jgi:uncharacterized membrane protein YhiD involved in acid resistance
MTFNDIFKSDFLNKVTGFSLIDSIVGLLTAFLIGMYIYAIYKRTYGGVMYSRPFNVALVALTMLTTFVILAVTSDVVLSLGMVGALSIVRFRTAIKDPMDLVFLFWAIGCGIVVGAGLIPLALLGSLAIGLLLVIFARRVGDEAPYLLVANCAGSAAEASVLAAVRSRLPQFRLKSKTVSAANAVELVLEVRIKQGQTSLVNEISSLPGVVNTVLVSYNGDYAI